MSAAPQAGGVRALHAWIIIALLALILAVSSVGLALQSMPMSMGGIRDGGGANFVPNQSFPGGQSQDFEAPGGGDATQGGTTQGGLSQDSQGPQSRAN
jgi:hypothetical protein